MCVVYFVSTRDAESLTFGIFHYLVLGAQCDVKDFMSVKNPLTLAGIKPATFRFVAQHLNHCATAVPPMHNRSVIYSTNGKYCLVK